MQDAVGRVRAESEQITAESAKLRSQTVVMRGEMLSAGEIAHETSSNIEEITIGLNSITTSVEAISRISDEVDEIGGTLTRATDFFQ